MAHAAASAAGQTPAARQYDLLLRDARLLDGSGTPWVRTDIAIAGGRIAAVGRLPGASAAVELDLHGLHVAPGFIDTHSHAAAGLADEDRSDARALLAQGITTVLVNPDGGGASDIARQQRSLTERMDRPDDRARLASDIGENLERRGGADRIQFRRFRPDASIEGRSLAAVAAARGQDPVTTTLELLRDGGASVVSFNMDASDVERLMQQPWTMTASDGELATHGVGVPHPRSYGTFPRKLGHYARDRGVVDPGSAIRSMTHLPATVYGIPRRGLVLPGYAADLVVFDLDRLNDPATFLEPHQYAEGMVHVLVNGRFAIRDGAFTGERAGVVLRKDRPDG